MSSSIKLMRMENGLDLLDYGRLRKAGNIVSYTGGLHLGSFKPNFVFAMKTKLKFHKYKLRP